MSYRREGGDSRDSRRHSSSSRRDSPPRHRSSRRSPSPGPSRRSPPPRPRDPQTLPESFGRAPEAPRTDDDLSVLQRMKASYGDSPLQSLYTYVESHRKVKIWTRNYKEVRGVMTGYIVAFDKHWNIVLCDVDEVYLKSKKCKTPFLRDVAANENLPDIPAKVPKKKSDKPKDPPVAQPKKEGTEKKRRNKKAKATSEKRQVDKLFIRGDNIVIISPAEISDDDEEEEEEGETEEVIELN